MKNFLIYIVVFVLTNGILTGTTAFITGKMVELWSIPWFISLICSYFVATRIADAYTKP